MPRSDDLKCYEIENSGLANIAGGYYKISGWEWSDDPERCQFDAVEYSDGGYVISEKCELPDSAYHFYFPE